MSSQKLSSYHKVSVNKVLKIARVSFHKNFKALTTTILMDSEVAALVWALWPTLQRSGLSKGTFTNTGLMKRISYTSMPKITTLLKQAGSRQIPKYPVTNILINSTSMRK